MAETWEFQVLGEEEDVGILGNGGGKDVGISGNGGKEDVGISGNGGGEDIGISGNGGGEDIGISGKSEMNLNERLKYYEIIKVNRRIEKRGIVDNNVLYNKQERLTF
ncbi:unnamed protein product, partial [Onchocerca ochengi]|uniref:Uncharacterized protein n=1 Tax=Onchocerca ochengi TaxID=42157 RepID=A0A182EWR4_ONCOC